MRVLISIVAGVLVGALLWPTSDCIRTVVGGGENAPSCTSVIGLPAHEVAAIVIGGLVVGVVWRLLRSRFPGV